MAGRVFYRTGIVKLRPRQRLVNGLSKRTTGVPAAPPPLGLPQCLRTLARARRVRVMGDNTALGDIGGPFVSVATLCERVLEEKDGVLSLIRVVDRFSVETFGGGTAPAEMLSRLVPQATLALILKSGGYRGTMKVTVRVRRPNGEYAAQPKIEAPAVFDGDEQGVAMILTMPLPVWESGLHWVDVEADGRLLTRVPLRVEVRSTPDHGKAEP